MQSIQDGTFFECCEQISFRMLTLFTFVLISNIEKVCSDYFFEVDGLEYIPNLFNL